MTSGGWKPSSTGTGSAARSCLKATKSDDGRFPDQPGKKHNACKLILMVYHDINVSCPHTLGSKLT